jgi:hypothetical protein
MVSNSTVASLMPCLDSYTIQVCRGRSQSTGLVSLIEDTAKQYQQENGACKVEVQTQDTSQGFDSILITAGWERTDHIVIQL